MTLMCEDQELLEGFLTESTELLEKIDDDLVVLEQTPDDMELLNRIFRSIHTVKGAASFLEFELLVKVSHKTEDVLNKLRRGDMSVTPEIMDVILEAIDLVKVLINDIKGNEIVERPIEGTIERLVALLENNEGSAAAATAPAEAPAAIESGDNATTMDTPRSDDLPPDEPEHVSAAEQVPIPEQVVPQVASAPARPAAAAPANVSQQSPPKGEELTDKSTVRVEVKRIDDLMNQVGELVLERNRMIQLSSDFQNEMNMDVFGEELGKLSKRINFVTSELQTQVLKMRLFPVGSVFKKFPRIVRNLARDLGKKVNLQVSGEDTELDRSVVDEIGDPLIHLLRNAMDHGLETPEERKAAGKTPIGTIVLTAHHEGNHIIISIKDDGRGIDADRVAAKALEKGLISSEQLAILSQRDIFDLIFLPGFSTKEKASDLSGRGVGMDVVKTNIRKLNGIIDIKSEKNKGSEFILKLPLTLAIIQSLLVEVGVETYSIPLTAVLETLRIKSEEFHSIGGRKVLKLRDSVLPLLDLSDTFDVQEAGEPGEFRYVVVVGAAEKRLGLVVSRLMGQQEVAIKSLGTYLNDVEGIAGSTILGDGRVALIVDPAKLIDTSS